MLKHLFVAVSLISLMKAPSACAAPHLDFNGDGISELPLVSVGGDGAITWTLWSGITGVQVGDAINFGVSGNHIGIGNWTNKTIAEIVALKSDGKNIV